VLVAEQGTKMSMPDFGRHLLLYKIKKYASTVLYFFSAAKEGGDDKA
jgi:hypothetical protein